MTAPTPQTDETTRREMSSALILCSVIFHIFAHPDGDSTQLALRLLVLGACLLGVCLPQRWTITAATLVINLYWAWEMPFIADHVYLQGALLIVLLPAWFDRAPARRPRELIFVAIAMYIFVALAKLNVDFFDPVNSCASLLYGYFSRFWGVFTSLQDTHAVPLMAALTEVTILGLLLWRKTRIWGALLGVGFHITLSSPPNIQVQDYNLALLATFVMLYDDARLSFWRRLRWQRALKGATLVLGVAVLIRQLDQDEHYMFQIITYTLFYMLIYGCIMWMSVGQLRHIKRLDRAQWPKLRASSIQAKLLIALFLLNGLMPYMGLKTLGSFTMFSNLTITRGKNNHFFMPQLTGPQHQALIIYPLESDHPRLAETAKDGLGLTQFELDRIAWSLSDQGAQLRYVTNKDQTIKTMQLWRVTPSIKQRILHKMFIYRSFRRQSKACVI